MKISFGRIVCMLVGFLVAGLSAGGASAYRLGGPSSAVAPASGSYAFDGANWTAYRAAVGTQTNFGPMGIKAPVPIVSAALPTINADTLSDLDGFLVPWWADADSTASQVSAVVDFFLAGGDLILLQDDTAHDEIGQTLGVPIAGSSDGSVSNGTSPFFQGPFGNAVNVGQSGSHGFLSAATVASTGGTVAATNTAGQVTAAHWRRGDWAPGAGALLIVTDVDMWTGLASYGPQNANGIFALNATALLRTAPAYRLAGPAFVLTPQSTSWAWDGGVQMAPYRSAIQDPARFGPGGIVPIGIETADLDVVDSASLASVDGFVSSYWSDADTTPDQIEALIVFFLEGGDLILLQDSSLHDAIGQALGIPTIGSSGFTPSRGGAPLFAGPFGRAASADQTGFAGTLSASDVAAHGGTIAATNEDDLVTAAVWNRGDFGTGAGRLVIVTDVDMFAAALATYSPLDDNGRFALNATAFAVAARSYRIGGPRAVRTPSNGFWAWDGGYELSGYRFAVEHAGNFGPKGIVGPRAIETLELQTLTGESLSQVDAFVAPWWHDGDTKQGEVNAIVRFFAGGGDLILLQDSGASDPVGEALGLPTIDASDGSPSNGGAPLFVGPFGTAANVLQAGDHGYLDPVAIAANGGTIAATNASGQVTAAIWNPGEYSDFSGRLLILTDIDMWTVETAGYLPPDDNGRFALNATAFVRGPTLLAGPGAALTPGNTAWSWQGGAAMSGYRTAVESPLFFGPGGLVPIGIDTVDFSNVDAARLSRVDAFIAPWWSDADATPAMRTAVVDFFLAGGDLILLQDDASHDPIGEELGSLETLLSTPATPSNGGAPLFVGPFGNAVDVEQQGSFGRLDAGVVALTGGAVIGTNAAAEITAAFWGRGTFAPGAGRLLVTTDIDMWATTLASYAPLDANGRFALNGTWAAVPEPGMGGLVGSGCALLAGIAARRARRRSR